LDKESIARFETYLLNSSCAKDENWSWDLWLGSLKPLLESQIDDGNQFGPQLTYDAFGCTPESVTSLDLISGFLSFLPEKIGMERISPPYVFQYSGKEPLDWGITGTVILAESHCSAHSFPDRDNFVAFDILSCKSFDIDATVEALNNFFKPREFVSKVVYRGKGFKR
jgi:S-adenosylmethionine decarboxylase